MSDLQGQVLLNRYQINALAGRGGMADVYQAYDTRRGYAVAIKVLREDLAEDTEFVRRFKAEAHTLSQLQHANIVRFYSFEQQEYLAFIVMDYIDGITLRRRILQASGPLPVDDALGILKQVGNALHYAHAEGVLHRDVKPGNVMLTSDGKALLSDFGIARMMDTSTMTAVMPGTPAYMSPEHFLGQPLSVATDVYSLGVMAYEMLAGRRPFVGDSGSSTGSSQREALQSEHLRMRPLPLSRINPAIPAHVETAVLKALEKRPAQRFESIAAFMAALAPQPVTAPRPTPVPSPKPGITPPQVSAPITPVGLPVTAPPAVVPAPEVVGPAAAAAAEQQIRRRGRLAVLGVILVAVLLMGIMGLSGMFRSNFTGNPPRPTVDLPVVMSSPTEFITETGAPTATALPPSLTPTGTDTSTPEPTASPTSTATKTSSPTKKPSSTYTRIPPTSTPRPPTSTPRPPTQPPPTEKPPTQPPPTEKPPTQPPPTAKPPTQPPTAAPP